MVVIGTSDQVIYFGIATKADALAVGNSLRKNEYFQDRGAVVPLNKEIGSTTISFGVQDVVWNQAGMLSSFEEVAREVAPAVGGIAVQFHLVDSQGGRGRDIDSRRGKFRWQRWCLTLPKGYGFRRPAGTILRRAICSFFSSTLIYIDCCATGDSPNCLVNRIIGPLCRALEQDCVRSLEIAAI